MKILIVTGIFPPDHGGPASYVPSIASALMERGHKIIGIITLSDKLIFKPPAYPFPVFRIPRKLPRLLRFIWVIRLIYAHAYQVDVFYLNGLVLEGIIATKLFRPGRTVVKVVGDLIWEKAQSTGATQDNLDLFQTRRQPILWQFLKRLQGWYTAKADAVITPSKYLAEVVKKWGVPPERIHVIYNAVKPPLACQINSEVPKIYDLVTVARLVPWKGLCELVSISAQNNWTLRIVGGGPLEAEIRSLIIKLNAERYISLAGQVSQHMVSKEIKSARIFVLNSSYEGLPHIVLEAKAAGVPVVATSAGGTPETIVDGVNGYLIPVGDYEALTDRLRFLLNHPKQCKNIADDGLIQVASQFSFDTMVTHTESVLRMPKKSD